MRQWTPSATTTEAIQCNQLLHFWKQSGDSNRGKETWQPFNCLTVPVTGLRLHADLSQMHSTFWFLPCKIMRKLSYFQVIILLLYQEPPPALFFLTAIPRTVKPLKTVCGPSVSARSNRAVNNWKSLIWLHTLKNKAPRTWMTAATRLLSVSGDHVKYGKHELLSAFEPFPWWTICFAFLLPALLSHTCCGRCRGAPVISILSPL